MSFNDQCVNATFVTIRSTVGVVGKNPHYVQCDSHLIAGERRITGYRGKVDVKQLTTRDFNRFQDVDSSPVAERNTSEPVYELREDECVTHKLVTFTGEAGVIHGYLNSINWPRDSPPYCDLNIVVSEGKHVEATLDFTRQTENLYIKTSEDPNFKYNIVAYKMISRRYFPLLISRSNQIFLRIPKSKRITEFNLTFSAIEENMRKTLPLVQTSPTSGYITTWGFDNNRGYPCFTNASRTLHIPSNHVAMICDGKGFKMIYSLHPVHEAPAKLDSGLWDCSVTPYNKFKQHLECNLEQECQGGEDEGSHCPFSSPSCNGSVAVANKCYVFFNSEEDITFY
ncbi:hypothetical protein C0Q70_12332 [Pomacea canaliculata]|uniref:CUB domain-containing protein n=1 Tax=Pomacea canaliculata TaxID=400727 RepID=A0A2T7P175_POMCA|nr:hypothetical protein C0Q70_12332 [Pomacea canaliculata]